MIHTTEGTQKRRIAVIAVPRPQRARMGYIRQGGPVPAGTPWTTIAFETPDSSAGWISTQLLQQAQARQTTPGTLSYTPASVTPAPNVSPWNSWLSPNCPDGSTTAADSSGAPITPAGRSWLWAIVGVLGAAASAVYLYENAKYKGGRF